MAATCERDFRIVIGLLAASLCAPTGDALARGSVETDRATLVSLYQATGGPNWTRSTGWSSSAPLSAWFGVTAEGGRVTELNLPGNALRGSLPDVLGNLALLQRLHLGSRWDSIQERRLYNALSGPIPDALGNLENLRVLLLWDNVLSGAIPDALGNLANLQLLDLNDNQLSGAIPEALGNLENLEQASFAGNQLSGLIPDALGSLASLEWLFLARNRLNGPVPEALGNLGNLEWLALNSRVVLTPLSEGRATITVTAGGVTHRFIVRVLPVERPADAIRIGPAIRAIDFLALRTAVAALRARENLPPFQRTDPVLTMGATPVKRVHLTELRDALGEVYDALGRRRPAYTDRAIIVDVTGIEAAHVEQLRAAVLALTS